MKTTMPIWVTFTLLFFSLVLLIFAQLQGLTWTSHPEFYLLALVCFVPCYAAGLMDISKSKLSFEWAFLFFLLPGIAPFVYYPLRLINKKSHSI